MHKFSVWLGVFILGSGIGRADIGIMDSDGNASVLFEKEGQTYYQICEDVPLKIDRNCTAKSEMHVSSATYWKHLNILGSVPEKYRDPAGLERLTAVIYNFEAALASKRQADIAARVALQKRVDGLVELSLRMMWIKGQVIDYLAIGKHRSVQFDLDPGEVDVTVGAILPQYEGTRADGKNIHARFRAPLVSATEVHTKCGPSWKVLHQDDLTTAMGRFVSQNIAIFTSPGQANAALLSSVLSPTATSNKRFLWYYAGTTSEGDQYRHAYFDLTSFTVHIETQAHNPGMLVCVRPSESILPFFEKL